MLSTGYSLSRPGKSTIGFTIYIIAVIARALTLGVTNDCKSMSVKLRYWIVNIIQRDTARPLVSRLCILKGSFT